MKGERMGTTASSGRKAAKMLACVLALAMVACAVVAVIPDENNNEVSGVVADEAIPTTDLGNLDGDHPVIVDGTTYVVSEGSETAYLRGNATTGSNIILKPGASITLIGEATGDKISIFPAVGSNNVYNKGQNVAVSDVVLDASVTVTCDDYGSLTVESAYVEGVAYKMAVTDVDVTIVGSLASSDGIEGITYAYSEQVGTGNIVYYNTAEDKTVAYGANTTYTVFDKMAFTYTKADGTAVLTVSGENGVPAKIVFGTTALTVYDDANFSGSIVVDSGSITLKYDKKNIESVLTVKDSANSEYVFYASDAVPTTAVGDVGEVVKVYDVQSLVIGDTATNSVTLGATQAAAGIEFTIAADKITVGAGDPVITGFTGKIESTGTNPLNIDYSYAVNSSGTWTYIDVDTPYTTTDNNFSENDVVVIRNAVGGAVIGTTNTLILGTAQAEGVNAVPFGSAEGLRVEIGASNAMSISGTWDTGNVTVAGNVSVKAGTAATTNPVAPEVVESLTVPTGLRLILDNASNEATLKVPAHSLLKVEGTVTKTVTEDSTNEAVISLSGKITGEVDLTVITVKVPVADIATAEFDYIYGVSDGTDYTLYDAMPAAALTADANGIIVKEVPATATAGLTITQAENKDIVFAPGFASEAGVAVTSSSVDGTYTGGMSVDGADIGTLVVGTAAVEATADTEAVAAVPGTLSVRGTVAVTSLTVNEGSTVTVEAATSATVADAGALTVNGGANFGTIVNDGSITIGTADYVNNAAIENNGSMDFSNYGIDNYGTFYDNGTYTAGSGVITNMENADTKVTGEVIVDTDKADVLAIVAVIDNAADVEFGGNGWSFEIVSGVSTLYLGAADVEMSTITDQYFNGDIDKVVLLGNVTITIDLNNLELAEGTAKVAVISSTATGGLTVGSVAPEADAEQAVYSLAITGTGIAADSTVTPNVTAVPVTGIEAVDTSTYYDISVSDVDLDVTVDGVAVSGPNLTFDGVDGALVSSGTTAIVQGSSSTVLSFTGSNMTIESAEAIVIASGVSVTLDSSNLNIKTTEELAAGSTEKYVYALDASNAVQATPLTVDAESTMIVEGLKVGAASGIVVQGIVVVNGNAINSSATTVAEQMHVYTDLANSPEAGNVYLYNAATVGAVERGSLADGVQIIPVGSEVYNIASDVKESAADNIVFISITGTDITGWEIAAGQTVTVAGDVYGDITVDGTLTVGGSYTSGTVQVNGALAVMEDAGATINVAAEATADITGDFTGIAAIAGTMTVGGDYVAPEEADGFVTVDGVMSVAGAFEGTVVVNADGALDIEGAYCGAAQVAGNMTAGSYGTDGDLTSINGVVLVLTTAAGVNVSSDNVLAITSAMEDKTVAGGIIYSGSEVDTVVFAEGDVLDIQVAYSVVVAPTEESEDTTPVATFNTLDIDAATVGAAGFQVVLGADNVTLSGTIALKDGAIAGNVATVIGDLTVSGTGNVDVVDLTVTGPMVAGTADADAIVIDVSVGDKLTVAAPASGQYTITGTADSNVALSGGSIDGMAYIGIEIVTTDIAVVDSTSNLADVLTYFDFDVLYVTEEVQLAAGQYTIENKTVYVASGAAIVLAEGAELTLTGTDVSIVAAGTAATDKATLAAAISIEDSYVMAVPEGAKLTINDSDIYGNVDAAGEVVIGDHMTATVTGSVGETLSVIGYGRTYQVSDFVLTTPLTVYGNVVVNAGVDFGVNSEVTVMSSGSLTVSEGAVLDAAGVIEGSGDVVVDGTMNVTGTLAGGAIVKGTLNLGVPANADAEAVTADIGMVALVYDGGVVNVNSVSSEFTSIITSWSDAVAEAEYPISAYAAISGSVSGYVFVGDTVDNQPAINVSGTAATGNVAVVGITPVVIDGTLDIAEGEFVFAFSEHSSEGESGETVTEYGVYDYTVDGIINVAAGATIVNYGDLTVAGTGEINVTEAVPAAGSSVAGIQNLGVDGQFTGTVNATYYDITAEGQVTRTYKAFDNAVAFEGAVDGNTVTVIGAQTAGADAEVSLNVVIADGAGLTVAQDVTLTIAADGSMDNQTSGDDRNIKVQGTLEFMDYTKYTEIAEPVVPLIAAEVAIPGEEGTNAMTFTSLANALDMDMTDIVLNDDVTISGDVTIGPDQTVSSDRYGVTVEDDASLTVQGALELTGTSPGVTQETATDAQGNTTQGEVAVEGMGHVYVPYATVTDEETGETADVANRPTTAGAYYDKLVGEEVVAVVATIDYAAADSANVLAADVDGQNVAVITVLGAVEAEGALAFTAPENASLAVVVISNDVVESSLTAAEVVLGDGTAITVVDSVVDATVGTAAGEADVELAGVAGSFVIGASEGVIVLSDVPEGEYGIEIVLGITAGAVEVTGTAVIGDLTVDGVTDAGLEVSGEATVVGELYVGEESVLTVTGTMDVEGTVYVDSAVLVSGTVEASGYMGLYGPVAIYGGSINAVGDGTVAIVDGAVVTEGGSIDGADLGEDASVYAYGECAVELTNGVSTAFNVNVVGEQQLYMTVYVHQDAVVYVSDFIGDEAWVFEDELIDATVLVSVSSWFYSELLLSNTVLTSQTVIGDYADVYAKVNYVSIGITVSQGDGIVVYIDGINVNDIAQGATVFLTVGDHEISYSIRPSYNGDDISVKFAGQDVAMQDRTGSITVTTSSSGALLSVTGATPADTTIVIPTPEPTPSTDSGDDGLSLTDILLIVLVVLIVVMAIIVALRLMRS